MKVEAVRSKNQVVEDSLVHYLASVKKIKQTEEKKIPNKIGNNSMTIRKKRELSNFGIKLNVTTIN